MIVYWLLLLPIAAIAYFVGSMDTLVLASNFVFHRSLHRLGRGNVFISNFYRIYKVKGIILLVLVEVIRDVLPILIGGWILGIKGYAETGRAFAGFCLVLGRTMPIYYGFKGSHASICLIIAAMLIDTSSGIVIGLIMAAVIWFSKYISVGTLVGAVMCMAIAVVVVDDKLCMLLLIFTGAVVLISHIPRAVMAAKGQEEKLSFIPDITYKLDDRENNDME